MSIKIKLLLSYLGVLILPLFMVVALYAISAYLISFYMNGQDFEALRQKIKAVPNLTTDPAEWGRLEQELNLDRKKLMIVVRKGKSVIYHSKSLHDRIWLENLPATVSIILEANHGSHLVKQYKFIFADGTPGDILQLLDTKISERIRQQWNQTANITALLVIVISLVFFTWILSRVITRPIGLLTKASERIQTGDLNFPIRIRSKDEIGQLAQTFQEMRRQLKESIEAQLEYEKQRQEMVAGISHDLKTPITAIKGYVEGILDGVANSTEKVDKYVQTISTKASDIDRLLDELILFSKLDLKNYSFAFETVDLRAFFRDCFEELRLELTEKKIWLSFNPGGMGPLPVNADRDKLKRVILNLVSNSVKYIDRQKIHSEIRFELTDGGSEVAVSIADNGQGIKAEDLPYIFDRFFRTDRARNSATGGSGLGLAIAKLIIEAHEGKIWVESELGTGTRITFTLKKVEAIEKNINYRG